MTRNSFSFGNHKASRGAPSTMNLARSPFRTVASLFVAHLGMSTSALYAAIGFLIGAHTSAMASCTLESFGEKKAEICRAARCGAEDAPKEITNISRGIYSEYIGLFINAGFSRWLGLDLERFELVEVELFSGKRFAGALERSRKLKPAANHYWRQTITAESKTIAIVQKKRVIQSEIDDLICAANALWGHTHDPKLGPSGRVAPMTDAHNKLYLLDRDAAKDFGGPGELTEAPRKLRERLDALQKQM